jgi:hypothetical protein
MSKHGSPMSCKSDQITNHPTNQGRHTAKVRLCSESRVSLSASALAGVEGYTQINLSQGAGVSILDSPVKGNRAKCTVVSVTAAQPEPVEFITSERGRCPYVAH